MNEQTFYICNAIFLSGYWIIFFMNYPKTSKELEEKLKKKTSLEVRIESELWKSFYWSFFGGTVAVLLIGNLILWLLGIIYNLL